MSLIKQRVCRFKPLPGQPRRGKDWEGLHVKTLHDIACRDAMVIPAGTEGRLEDFRVGRFRLFKRTGLGVILHAIWCTDLEIDQMIPMGMDCVPIKCAACRQRLKPDILQRCQCYWCCYKCGAELPAVKKLALK